MLRRKNELLEQHLAEAHEKIARLESDPFRAIGEEIARKVQEEIDNGNLASAIDAAVEDQRQIMRARLIGAVAARKATELIEQDKLNLSQEAEEKAQALAEARLQRFREEEAPAYLASQTELLSKTHLPKMIEAEKAQLRHQALEDLGIVAAKAAVDMFNENDPRGDKAYNKERAAKLRMMTKKSRVLELSRLQHNDELEIVFVARGKGNEAYTESGGYGWSATERTELIERKLTMRLTDPEAGSAIITEDSWNNDAEKDGIYNMTPVNIFCLNPVTRTDEFAGINKAAPLTLTDENGGLLSDAGLEVWYAKLNEYKVLS